MSNVRRQSEFVLAASIRDQLSRSRKACSFSSCPSLIYSSASVTLPVLRSLPSLSSSGTDSSTIWPELTKLRFVCSRRDAPILTYQLRLFTSLRHETHWPLPATTAVLLHGVQNRLRRLLVFTGCQRWFELFAQRTLPLCKIDGSAHTF